MKAREPATEHGVGHSNQRSKLHGIDVIKNEELREKRKQSPSEPREAVPSDEEPVFRSDISALGGGKCFQILEGGLVEMEGDAWEDALWRKALELSWYHQPQTRKLKSGTVTELKRRKLKDRIKLGRTDKHGRAQTDMMRETIDLRPDHSRVIQYMLEAGMPTESRTVIDETRNLKIRLFEKIYNRHALFDAEHDDSGQLHDDIWHSGIEEDPNQMIKGRENRKTVTRPRRDRVPYRNYGVGVGAASWSRHFSALHDAGYEQQKVQEFAGATMAALEEDTQQVRDRYKCRPRDARLLAVLDRLVHRKLKKIAPEITEKANREYAAFLAENYRAGKIGAKESKRRTIATLRQELAIEKQRSELFEKEADALREKSKQFEEEAFATLKHLSPFPGESMEHAAQRIVKERNRALERFHWLWEQVMAFVRLFFGERFHSLLSEWPEEVRNAVEELAKALEGRPADIRGPEKLESKSSQPIQPLPETPENKKEVPEAKDPA